MRQLEWSSNKLERGRWLGLQLTRNRVIPHGDIVNWSDRLKKELRECAGRWTSLSGAQSCNSLGTPGTVLFTRSSDSHGNFFGEVWKALTADDAWSRRLDKTHSQLKAIPEDYRSGAKELDSSNSSDALLINCFCFPGSSPRFAAVLGVSPVDAKPAFGVPGQLRLRNGSVDKTELDMVLGDTIVEAKLTEADFTAKSRPHVLRYEDLEAAFEIALLPSDAKSFYSFQLIRNVLAAAQLHRRLVVLIDLRRPDLLQAWWKVHAAIRPSALRARCFVHFWQELAAEADEAHRQQLRAKYGL